MDRKLERIERKKENRRELISDKALKHTLNTIMHMILFVCNMSPRGYHIRIHCVNV